MAKKVRGLVSAASDWPILASRRTRFNALLATEMGRRRSRTISVLNSYPMIGRRGERGEALGLEWAGALGVRTLVKVTQVQGKRKVFNRG